ncbi:MAG: carboxypeptidase regulatory-like domain-containing protein [Candidatus Acidiferrales bacterium]
MQMMTMCRSIGIGSAAFGMIAAAAIVPMGAGTRPSGAAAQTQIRQTGGAADEIAGVVTSSNGPEAGVWVIAETSELPTQFRKIVVTDDQGRYLIPQLPQKNYKVWVRGYGLVDSQPAEAMPGATLDLRAVVAPDARAAAQYYPADYWYSLMQLPLKTAFPMTIGSKTLTEAAWIYRLKRGCASCHQLGNKFTREIPSELGHFDSGVQAWQRRIESGQMGASMVGGVSQLGYDSAIAMFADWTDRVAAGELPPAPARPQGLERNVVITLWDVGTPKSFVHDAMSTDKHHPTANAYGPVYATEWSSGMLEGIDPVEDTKFAIPVPVPEVAAEFRRTHPQTFLKPSPYWGREVVFDDTLEEEAGQLDSKGRVWFILEDHREAIPPFCNGGTSNPFGKNFPIGANGRQIAFYDPKTGKFGLVDTCFGGSHEIIDNDKDETLYVTAGDNGGPTSRFGIGWVKTRVWDQTHDGEKSQGWCPAVVDYNGDGKTGAFTKLMEPPDPTLDREVPGGGYGISVNPVDHSVWYASQDPVPGRIVRMTLGSNPPATCLTEAFEPPFHNPAVPDVEAYSPEGIDVDTDGVVWTALAGTNQLASFDRRKCKVFKGPAATGQQCPEGWTLYPVPGPTFKGSTVAADFFYYNWVDRFNTFGLGDNVPVITGTDSDSLIVFDPRSKKLITLRVPYPLGFYTRYVDGRIDDPKAGWKGRGLWSSDDTRVSFHNEGGKGTTSYIAHFQLRPDPLAH